MVSPQDPAKVPVITDERFNKLIRHAVVLNLSTEKALDYLLDLPAVPRELQRKRWTEKELTFLRDPRNSPASLARILGRSPASISNKRHQIGVEENRPDLMRRPQRKP